MSAEIKTGRRSSRTAAVNGEAHHAFDFRNVAHQRLFIEDSHANTLSSFAAAALREGRFQDAFMFADRRCRIGPIAGPSEYMLRATALVRLNNSERAHDDLRNAAEIDPGNVLANRAILASDLHEERGVAAKALLRHEIRPVRLRQVLQTLDLPENCLVGVLTARFDGVHGWMAWRCRSTLIVEVSWDTGNRKVFFEKETSRPLSGALGSATDIFIEWPDNATYVKFAPEIPNVILLDPVALRPDRRDFSALKTNASPSPGKKSRQAAIIVPVYSDYEATALCIGTLLRDCALPEGQKIILINDASPDRQINELVEEFAAHPSVQVIRHEVNLGFARSVNDALDSLSGEDIVMLNSDTVPTPQFLARLAGAAYSAPGIGTVTPFANNGEYSSFPVPFRENELPAPERILAIDRIAARVNRGKVVDMPNGTGFCMYVTRACLDAVGGLSVNYGRGYFEDVDFCLRAAQAGFRNVCATDVFVGHSGSRSFRADKRALVVRNLATLEARFPNYRALSGAFMSADPLATAREAIEHAAIDLVEPVVLLIAAEFEGGERVRQRADDLHRAGERALVAGVCLSAGMVRLRLRDPADGIPQSMRLNYPIAEAEKCLNEALGALPIVRAEFLDFPETPACMTAVIESLGIPYQVNDKHRNFRKQKSHNRQTMVPAVAEPRLGVLADARASTLSFLIDLAQAASVYARFRIVVIGSTFDDLRLMACGPVFCTGPVTHPERRSVFEHYGLTHLLSLENARYSKANSAEHVPVPTASLDAAVSVVVRNIDRDLIIPATTEASAVVAIIAEWMTPSRAGKAWTAG